MFHFLGLQNEYIFSFFFGNLNNILLQASRELMTYFSKCYPHWCPLSALLKRKSAVCTLYLFLPIRNQPLCGQSLFLSSPVCIKWGDFVSIGYLELSGGVLAGVVLVLLVCCEMRPGMLLNRQHCTPEEPTMEN